jgi:hypothetical protein
MDVAIFVCIQQLGDSVYEFEGRERQAGSPHPEIGPQGSHSAGRHN